MSKVLVTESNLQDIADAIRSKSENPDVYRPGDMAAAILAIPTESATLVSKTIVANGEYDPGDDDADGYSEVTVNVPNSYSAADEGKVVSSGALVAQSSTTVTQNGTYDTTENNEVVVNVSGGGSTLVPKTITENGTYDPADDNADGYSRVVVNVSGGGETIQVYAFSFIPSNNASTVRSAGLRISPIYNLKVVGVRFWARDSTCSVYISDASGNIIASKLDVTVTANNWNDVMFDTPVTLNKNTSYVIWGSNASSTMKYISTSLSSDFVTLEAAVYATSANTFPTTAETGQVKYGTDLIFVVTV